MTQSNITRRDIVGTVATGVGLAAVASSGTFVGSASAQVVLKTFVLIPGAFCGGWYWRRLADLLEFRGHKVFCPTLTGLGERSHLLSKNIDLDTHITDIVNVINWESLEDICLVAHGYGSAPASGALEHIDNRVSSIVWLDAFKLESGQRVFDVTSDAVRKRIVDTTDKGQLSFPPPPKMSSIVVSEEYQAFVDSKLTPHPIRTYQQAISISGALEKIAKKTYIRIPKYPAPAFDKALDECKADKSWRTFELSESGHMAMLDAPEHLMDLLVQAA